MFLFLETFCFIFVLYSENKQSNYCIHIGKHTKSFRKIQYHETRDLYKL